MSNNGLFNEPDPWADENVAKNFLNKGNDHIKNDPSYVVNNLNFMSNSTTPSMVDSAIDAVDSLNFESGDRWSHYNSSNILHSHHNDLNTPNNSDSTDLKNSIFNTNTNVAENDVYGDNNDIDNENYGDDYDDEYEDIQQFSNSNIWSHVDFQKFNPLSNKHSLDGIDIKVKEIPEKEGLVFKHINYLITHTIIFGNSTQSNDINTQSKETKVIRRYSDFVWLLEVLWKKYPYRLIPELPPKQYGCMYS